jgi:hypothetical protein
MIFSQGGGGVSTPYQHPVAMYEANHTIVIMHSSGTLANEEYKEIRESKPMEILFGLASMAKHDCVSNIGNQISSAEEGFVMTFKARRTIQEGEEITISYSTPWSTFLERQEELAIKKFVVILFFFSPRQRSAFYLF